MNIQENLTIARDDEKSRRMSEGEVYKGIRIYVVTLLVLTVVAWCAVGIGRYTLHGPYPHPSLLAPETPFTDFTYLSARIAHFGEPNMLSRTDFMEPFAYPVPSIYAYLIFIRLFPNPLAAYLAFALLSFFIATYCFSLRVKRIAPGWLPQVAVWSTLLGFPLVILIDRGNIEAVIWVLVLLGIVAYTRDRILTSAILWALATSMKITSGLLFVLFLAKRKYGMFVLAIVATVAFSVLALAGVGPTIRQAASDSSKNAPYLRDTFILARVSPQLDESLFGATKQIIYLYTYAHGGSFLDRSQTSLVFLTALYLYNVLITLACILLYWFRLRRLPLLNQFMAYLLLYILLPQVSYEYKLVYIYFAWGAFLLFLLADVATGRSEIPAWSIHVILFSCAVIFVPLTPFAVATSAGHTFTFGGQVKAVFLIVILLTVLRVPMPSSLFGDLQLPAPRNART